MRTPSCICGICKKCKSRTREAEKRRDPAVRQIQAENQRKRYQAKTPEQRKARTQERVEYQREYRLRNAERLKEQQRAYQQEHKTELAKQKRAYYLAHRDEALEAARQRYLNDPEAVKQRVADWGKANLARCRSYKRKWDKQNPESKRAAVRRKYHRLKATEEGRQVIRDRANKFRNAKKDDPTWRERHKQQRRRWYASTIETRRLAGRVQAHRRRAMTIGTYDPAEIEALYQKQNGKCLGCRNSLGKKYEVDHVTPLCRGGLNVVTNLQLLCRRCNRSKGAKPPEQWAQQIGRLFV
jgi:5-methylcytosine-specific restriction endonuclease McrA